MKKFLLLLLAPPLLAKDLFFNLELTKPNLGQLRNKAAYQDYCELPKENDHFGEVSLTKIVSNRPNLDQIVNKGLISEGEMLRKLASDIDAIIATPSETPEATAEASDGVSDDGTSAENTTKEPPAKDKSKCHLKLRVGAGYFGHYKNLDIFINSFEQQTGNNKKLVGRSYLVINDEDRQLSLNDILESNKTTELSKLLAEKFLEKKQFATVDDYISKGGCCLKLGDNSNMDNELQAKILTDNFFFNTDGLAFSYDPFEIGTESEGIIVLTIPYEKLVGIVKEEYLP